MICMRCLTLGLHSEMVYSHHEEVEVQNASRVLTTHVHTLECPACTAMVKEIYPPVPDTLSQSSALEA